MFYLNNFLLSVVQEKPKDTKCGVHDNTKITQMKSLNATRFYSKTKASMCERERERTRRVGAQRARANTAHAVCEEERASK